jgi:hypothetical protein
MSNLTSLFDVLAGLPPHGQSAMENNFKQKAAESPIIVEGMVVALENEAGVPVVSKLTSAAVGAAPDFPWLCIQGMDQSDAAFADKVSVLSMKSGLIFKVATALTFAVGDLAYSNAGVLTKVAGTEQAVGQVIGAVSGSGYVIIAT